MRLTLGLTPEASLRAKLLYWLLPPMLAVLLASLLVSYDVALRVGNDAYDGGLLDDATDIAGQIRFSAGQPSLDLTAQAREMLTSAPGDQAYFRVLDSRGETVAGEDALPLPEAFAPEPRQLAYYDTSVRGLAVRAVAMAVAGPNGAGMATVIAAETLRRRVDIQHRLLALVLLPQLALIAAACAIIWFGITRGLRPLRELTQAVARRGWDDLTALDSGRTPRELRPLAEAINGLMRRLSSTLGSQQRFIANAAHQLRTPLAGLIAQTEIALAEGEPQAHRAALQQLRAASRRAVRLVNQLLTLARSEPGNEPSAHFARIDLAQLAERVTMDWVPEAIACNVDLGYASDCETAVIRGDELLLGEMLGNLIDNALRYGRQPGTTTVSLTCHPRLEISVQDDGPGIPEEELARVFERFHRVPGSPRSGAGLGLAIVREIAQAHRATVQARRVSAAGGTIVVVTFA
jgi:two-component system sensor histidine kinase TctE